MRLVPIIIFIIIVINVLRRIAEFNRKRPKTEDDWREWSAADDASAPPSPLRPSGSQAVPPRPTPSDRVREILEQLGQGGEPSPPPFAVPVPPPLPVLPSPVPPPLPVLRPVLQVPAPPPLLAPAARPAYAAPAVRRYLAEEAAAEPKAVVAATEPATPLSTRMPTTDAVYRESLRKAFPPAMGIIREARSQGRTPFTIRLRGRQYLRQAIVLAEVLGPPRAFDL
jgi:hypothetical protein